MRTVITGCIVSSFLALLGTILIIICLSPGLRTVPSIVGLRSYQAEARVKDTGFEFETKYRDQDEKDVVSDQNPAAGTWQFRNTKVIIYENRGLPAVPLPRGSKSTLNNTASYRKESASPSILLPKGTTFNVRLNDTLVLTSSSSAQNVEATLLDPINLGGKQLCMKGSRAFLQYDLTELRTKIVTRFRLVEVTLINGDILSIKTDQLTKVGTVPLKDVVIGAGIGGIGGIVFAAIIEALVGDIPDSLIALVSAGGMLVGGSVVATRDKKLTISAGEIVHFTLTEDAFVNFTPN